MIHHVQSFAVFVNNLDQAAVFYRDTLGLPVSKQGSFGLELFLEPPHLGVHPAVHADAKGLVGRHTGITFYVPGLLHFCGVLHERGVRFVSVRGAPGAALLARHPELAGVDSLCWVEGGEGGTGKGERVLVRSEAVLAVARYLGGWWRVGLAARVIPRALRDAGYSWFARR